MPVPSKIILFDCDSTLSAIEGVDEMGRLRGPEIFRAVEDMTNDAMNGGTPLEKVFAKRLEIIRPTRAMCDLVADLYDAARAPDLAATLATLRDEGWTAMIVSGGFRQAILPFAAKLGIDRVVAVDLFFDERGEYAEFDTGAPTARSGGKPDVVRMIRDEYPDSRIVMMGDGASDLECRGVADRFVGFGGFVSRPKVKAGADVFIGGFAELPAALKGL